MPSNSKKPLYLAKSIDDLHKLGEVDIGRKEEPDKHLKVAEKAFSKAEELWIEGDEEKSFILFMRYINSVENCKKTIAYSKSPPKYSKLISKDKFMTSLNRCEILKESLLKRYKEIRENEMKIIKPNPIKEVKQKGPFISPGELFALLSNKPPLAALLDCRGTPERNIGVPIKVPLVFLPTDRPLLSLSLRDVKLALSPLMLSINNILIALMDSNSQELSACTDTPVFQLRESLYKFDTAGELRETPRILDGGYESWSLHYPAYSDGNPAVKPVEIIPANDDVTFPTIDSPPPKDSEEFFKPRRAPPQLPTNGTMDTDSSSYIILDTNPITDYAGPPPTYESTEGIESEPTDDVIDLDMVPLTPSLPPIIPPKPAHLHSSMPTDTNNIHMPLATNNSPPSMSLATNNIPPSMPLTTNNSPPSMPLTTNNSPPSMPLATNIIPPSMLLATNNIPSSMPLATNNIPPSMTLATNNIPQSIPLATNEDLGFIAPIPNAPASNPRVSYGPVPTPPSYETALSLPPTPLPHVPLPPPVSLTTEPQVPLVSSLPVRTSDPSADRLGRELQEKERRLRELESQLAGRDQLEEKVRALEQQAGSEQKSIELQKQKMLQEIATEKQRADQELGEKQRRLLAMEEQTKQQLRQEIESIKLDKAEMEKEKNVLDNEKRQVAESKQQLERDKQEFERVKKYVSEQQKAAQLAQAANTSHQFLQEDSATPQMQLNHGLPVGWRKLFDSATGRFYYQDDTTKTTHWNPPTAWIVSQQPNIMQGKTKGALLSSFNQSDAKPISDPSVPASGQTETPIFDRTTKPAVSKTPEVPSRATKNPALSNPYYHQILARIQAKSKSRSFDPSYGGGGQALTGLKNLGNTCFMNSILQCLSATYPLAEYFITQRFIQHVNPVNPLGMGGEMAEEFAFLTQTLWRGNYKSIAPKDFKRILSKFAPQFSGSQQHDSQEFLAFLLDGLHEDLNKVLRKEYIQEQDNTGVPDQKAAQISWENHLKRNDSIIVDLFQGQFKSTLTCLQCGCTSVTFEAFMYLSVPIPDPTSVSLVDCVKHFTKAERVSGSNSWFCVRCKTHRESAKQLEIWRLPPVLLIHLKRFSYVGKWKQKLDTNVNFPLSGLDLSPMTLGPLKPPPYQLFAVSNHSGTLDGGHYTAYVRHAANRKFYNFDDSIVRDMSSSSVMSKNGYMLFYTSVDFTPKIKL